MKSKLRRIIKMVQGKLKKSPFNHGIVHASVNINVYVRAFVISLTCKSTDGFMPLSA